MNTLDLEGLLIAMVQITLDVANLKLPIMALLRQSRVYVSSFVGWSLLSATIKALATLLGHQRGGPALPWWPARKIGCYLGEVTSPPKQNKESKPVPVVFALGP